MQIITNTNLAQKIISRYTTFLSIAAAGADIVFLQPPVSEPQNTGNVINKQIVRHIYNCIEQNTLLSVNVNLQFLNNMLGRAVQQINSADRRAFEMTSHTIVLNTMQKERSVLLDVKATQIAMKSEKIRNEQFYNNSIKNIQTLSKTVLKNTMAQLVNNTQNYTNYEYLNTLKQSADITQNNTEMYLQERILKGIQKGIDTKEETSITSVKNSNLEQQYHKTQVNNSIQNDIITLQTQNAQPANSPLINKEKADSAGKAVIENFKNTVQKAQKALNIINKTQNLVLQTEIEEKTNLNINASFLSAQQIKNDEKRNDESNSQIFNETQELIMRKEQNELSPQISQNVYNSESAIARNINIVQNTALVKNLLKSTEILRNANENTVRQNTNAMDLSLAQNERSVENETVRNINIMQSTALVKKLLASTEILRNTSINTIQQNTNAMDLSFAQNERSIENETVRNINIMQSTALMKKLLASTEILRNTSKNTVQENINAMDLSFVQNKRSIENETVRNINIVQSTALVKKLLASTEALRNVSKNAVQQNADEAKVNLKQNSQINITNKSAAQLVYPIEAADNIAELAKSIGVLANNETPISRYLPTNESKIFAKNVITVRESIMQKLQYKTLTKQNYRQNKDEVQTISTQPVLSLQYSKSLLLATPQAKNNQPNDLSKVYERSEAPITRVLLKEQGKVKASKANKVQDEDMDIPTVRTKTNDVYETKNKSAKQSINTSVNLTQQSVVRENANIELDDAEVKRITDKVYRTIESRLRSEKMKRGMW